MDILQRHCSAKGRKTTIIESCLIRIMMSTMWGTTRATIRSGRPPTVLKGHKGLPRTSRARLIGNLILHSDKRCGGEDTQATRRSGLFPGDVAQATRRSGLFPYPDPLP